MRAHRSLELLVAMLLVATAAAVAEGQAVKKRDSRRLNKRQQPALVSPAAPTAPETEEPLRFITPDLLETSIDAETYVLGPGDVLAVMFVVGELHTEQLPVLPEGVVLVPNVGSVPAAGSTLAEFRKALRSALARRYRDFELYSYLAQPRQFRVYVTGEVAKPGVVAARAYERVSDVLERAGGLTEHASRRDIELRDLQGKMQARVDLAAFEAYGDLNANPLLSGGQMVWVPVLRNGVQLLGEVGVPGTYESRRGETLRDLLRLAGGPTPRADLEHVSVESMDSTGTVRVRSVDLRQDAPVVDDVVRVSLLSSTLGKNRVFVIMPGGEERTLFLASGETLRDLLPRVSQLQPDADLTQAELATQDENGKRVQVPVDVQRILKGEDNRPLRDGDILSIPRVKNYVYVSGFVTDPGAYPYRSDWTVNDYIGEAGGPTAGASHNRVKILGSDGSQRSGNRETRLQRGDTILLDRSFVGKTSSALGLFANLTALVISLVALRR